MSSKLLFRLKNGTIVAVYLDEPQTGDKLINASSISLEEAAEEASKFDLLIADQTNTIGFSKSSRNLFIMMIVGAAFLGGMGHTLIGMSVILITALYIMKTKP